MIDRYIKIEKNDIINTIKILYKIGYQWTEGKFSNIERTIEFIKHNNYYNYIYFEKCGDKKIFYFAHSINNIENRKEIDIKQLSREEKLKRILK